MLEKLNANVTPGVARILDGALSGRELTREDAEILLDVEGADFYVLLRAADVARQEDVGNDITYVVCRNINFTNVCYVGCSFCGFARHKDDADVYDHPMETMLEKARDAIARGATEVCIQGGIHPGKTHEHYREILTTLKAEFPKLHIHAFSPEEIHFGVEKSGGMSLHAYLKMLREAGLGTIPGTAAEILDDEIRRKLSPRKLMSGRWLEIVRAAHEVGLRSSSTLMYGHIESVEHIARHLELLRDLQKQTGGFTEFVPLGFIHHQTRLYLEQGSRPGASMPEDLRLVAVARLFLRPWIQNVQVSWVKMGWKMAQMGLVSGANDFGGTLMEESISQAAGSEHGDHIEVHEIEQLVREIGRPYYERTTTYGRREPRSDAATRPELAPSATPPIGFALGSGY